nr:phosphoribosylformylglycinamidine synthase [Gammaproteobacteria bacterium]
MLILPGPTALTRYRRAKLLHALQRERPVIEDVAARFLHFVDLAEPRDRDIRERLDALLNYGTPAEWATDSESRVVTPRFGTISPWSSKATDIAHTCGLAAVHRIERGVQYTLHSAEPLAASDWDAVLPLLHDRMTETVLAMPDAAQALFATHEPAPLAVVPLQRDGIDALERANVEFGLALSADEIAYLGDKYQSLGRDPTDAELMMFAQVNSEHCRHKIFNAHWTIDGETQRDSLFDMIRSTHAATPDGVLSAYQDNSAVIAGGPGRRFVADTESHEYQSHAEPVHILMKVETHNHPTAISPFPGAATGSGGEIRDEGATGRGARPKAGLTGFTVSDLELPGDRQPWERGPGRPDRIASPLQIMLEGPIGGASFNNEFGRPNILGYFRTFAAAGRRGKSWGYHKPIMIAGGMGAIRPADVDKQDAEARNLLVVLGGPAMLIGLGGGAASSMGSGTSSADLDFASVQRGNPEMQRRAQQVIDSCWSAGYRETGNPIGIIHDVGAGGLSNAVPEVVDHSKLGAQLELREVPNAEPGMSPLEIWCNEAQERYVM